ncbi:hypothetical protein MKZ38_001681 [Zalerion maritima]|uniref:Uncharacterized protein n=1 Tax=Zalerion maritima TaxID=339359 RepID=A0AAD5RQ02_9PEZI|nr:hypothetical protein MKZ38_001681 [Zalerion maritima]
MWERLKPTGLSQRGGRADDGNDNDTFAQNHWHTRGVSGGNKVYSYSIRAGPAPQRPQRPADFSALFKDTQQPQQLRPQEPTLVRPPKHLDHQLRSSQYRPASSIYSQPSPLQPQFAPSSSVKVQHVRKQRIADDNNVSPPSSPEALTPRDIRHQGPDISPIDEVPGMSQLDSNGGGLRPGSRSQGRSNIPMMRRERRKHQEQAVSHVRDTKSREQLQEMSESNVDETSPQSNRQHSDPRWDPMTGEITSSNLGRPSQVKPTEYAQGLGITNTQNSPNSNASFGERVRRKMPVSRPEVVFDSRPAWNGASGRTTLVAPVQDKPDVAPLRIPPKSTKRSIPRLGSASPPVSPETGRYATPISERTDGSASWSPASPATHTDAQAYPSPPNSDKPLNGRNAQFELDNAGTRGSGAGADSTAPSPPPQQQQHQQPRHLNLFQRAQQQLKNHQNQQQPLPSPENPAQVSVSAAATITTSEDLRQQSPIYHQELATSSPPVNDYNQQSTLSASHHVPQPSWSSSVYSAATNAAAPPPAPYPLPPLPTSNPAEAVRAAEQSNATNRDPWTQPPSRFSVTTYAPSTFGSPRPSQDGEAPPMPTPPQQFTSVLDRSRPKVGRETIGARPSKDKNSAADPIVISLKAPPFSDSPSRTGPLGSNPVVRNPRSRTWDTDTKSGRGAPMMAGALGGIPRVNSTSPTAAFPTAAAFSSTFKERRLSTSSTNTNKDLPPAPPEIEGNTNGDRVAILNAKIASLGNRRININKSIKQMTELMPADNLMASNAVLVKREEEKKKVEALKVELADVQRQEYELGLKLHRSYKRMDREANYESTSLWVKRATHD